MCVSLLAIKFSKDVLGRNRQPVVAEHFARDVKTRLGADQPCELARGVALHGDGSFWYNEPTKKRQASLHQSIRNYSKVFLTDLQQLIKDRFNLIGSISISDETPRLLYSHRPALIMYEHFPKEFLIKRKANKVEELVSLRGGWDQLKRKCKECGDRFIKYRHNQLYCSKCYNKNR